MRRDFSVIVVLATLGVLLSACVTATGMHYLAHWQWLVALVFGVLIPFSRGPEAFEREDRRTVGYLAEHR